MIETGKPIDRFFSEMRSFVSPVEPQNAIGAAAST
jgi:hypothetical protein